MRRLSALPSEPGRVLLLSRRSAVLLERPVQGRGGYQALLRRLQGGLSYMDGYAFLVTTVDDLNAVMRWCSQGGFKRLGGFQQVTKSLLLDMWRNAAACPETGEQQRLPFEVAPPRALKLIRGGKR